MRTFQQPHINDWLRLAALIFLMIAAMLAVLSLFVYFGHQPTEVPLYSDLSSSSQVTSRLVS